MQETEFYQVGRNGVRDLVLVEDPSDPFPKTVFGGVSIDDYLIDLERFSADPSFSGQISVAPRDRYTLPAWSINDSSTPSLVVNDSQVPEDIVAATLNDRTDSVIQDVIDDVLHDAIQNALEPAPVVPVPPLAKYVNLTEVEVKDAISQACGVKSPLSIGTSTEPRKIYKVTPRIQILILLTVNSVIQLGTIYWYKC